MLNSVGGLLASIATAPAIAVNSDWGKALSQIGALSRAVERYRAEHGTYPATSDESSWYGQLVDAEVLWDGLFELVEGVPVDPFGHPIVYEPPVNLRAQPGTPAAHFKLGSVGHNGIDDGGDGDDIYVGRGINEGYYCYVNRPAMWRLAKGFGLIATVCLVAAFAKRRVARSFVGGAIFVASLGVTVCLPMSHTSWGKGGFRGDLLYPLHTASMIVMTLCLVLVVSWPIYRAVRKQLTKEGCCQACGYELRDLPMHALRCPECGATIRAGIAADRA